MHAEASYFGTNHFGISKRLQTTSALPRVAHVCGDNSLQSHLSVLVPHFILFLRPFRDPTTLASAIYVLCNGPLAPNKVVVAIVYCSFFLSCCQISGSVTPSRARILYIFALPWVVAASPCLGRCDASVRSIGGGANKEGVPMLEIWGVPSGNAEALFPYFWC